MLHWTLQQQINRNKKIYKSDNYKETEGLLHKSTATQSEKWHTLTTKYLIK